MCGIAGAINFTSLKCDQIIKSLMHRGPDEQSTYVKDNVTLIHTRLSIQDVSHGTQPLTVNVDGSLYTIVFNGEIYNHLELRELLQEFTFTTLSDTETLLYMYIKYQDKMYEKLDGMFAFIILDNSRNKLVLARDKAGKKPLFIHKKDSQVFFASELNTIKSAIEKLEIDEESIYSYLRCGFFYKEHTPYCDVEELLAGHYYEINLSTLSMEKRQYFDILDYYKQPNGLGFDASMNELDNLLHKSIKTRLLSSDLEVGAFLSGGIDSSLIVAMASEYKQKLKTFTVKFDGAYDESYLAKLTATKYDTDHHEISIAMNLKDDIEKILLNYGQPFMDSSAIPSYYVSKEAKKYVTVILNGDGADELFGGYRRYVPAANNWISLAKKLSFLLNFLPTAHNKKSIYNYFYRLLSMSNKTGLDFYLSSTSDIFEDTYAFNSNTIFDQMENDISSVELDELSKMLYCDYNLILFSDLLVKMDIATMTNSLEGRSPFLSKYVMEFAPSLNNSFKVQGKNTKYILRELAKKYLPNELISQPKRGFEVPLKNWIDNELKDNIFDALNSNSYSQSFIDKKFINDVLYKKNRLSDEKRAKILWNLYCLEVWKKKQ